MWLVPQKNSKSSIFVQFCTKKKKKERVQVFLFGSQFYLTQNSNILKTCQCACMYFDISVYRIFVNEYVFAHTACVWHLFRMLSPAESCSWWRLPTVQSSVDNLRGVVDDSLSSFWWTASHCYCLSITQRRGNGTETQRGNRTKASEWNTRVL